MSLLFYVPTKHKEAKKKSNRSGDKLDLFELQWILFQEALLLQTRAQTGITYLLGLSTPNKAYTSVKTDNNNPICF